MKTRLDMNKIAAGLRAERRGKVSSSGGLGRGSCVRTLMRVSEFRRVAGERPIRNGPNAGSCRSRPAPSSVWRPSRWRFADTRASTSTRCRWRRCCLRRRPSG
jgi:hypothetical protein